MAEVQRAKIVSCMLRKSASCMMCVYLTVSSKSNVALSALMCAFYAVASTSI